VNVHIAHGRCPICGRLAAAAGATTRIGKKGCSGCNVNTGGIYIPLVPAEGIEPPTFGLQNRCSTAELSRQTHRQDEPPGSSSCSEA
jgi:hypothetical protein